MSKDLSAPATKQDVEDMGEELAQVTAAAIRHEVSSLRGDMDFMRGDITEMRGDITGLRGEMTEVRGDIMSLKQGQQAILQVVQSIDAQLKEHRDLPERVERLERTVFRTS